MLRCGCLLYGVIGRNCVSNTNFGPPLDRDGNIHNDVDRQPPFLLRFSPQLFAKEAPEIFEYDTETNGLKIKPGKTPPWIRTESKFKPSTDKSKTWLFCLDCKVRYCPDTKSVSKTYLPYRDRASQLNLAPPWQKHEFDSESQPEPCAEPPPDEKITDDIEDDDVVLPEMPLPEPIVTEYPTLDQYEEQWKEKLAKHAKSNAGEFNRDNLIPMPIPNLFQDCPYVPFDDLKSAEAQNRLSVCRPFSSFEHPRYNDGIPRYSSLTGEVNFRRRATRSLASTGVFKITA